MTAGRINQVYTQPYTPMRKLWATGLHHSDTKASDFRLHQQWKRDAIKFQLLDVCTDTLPIRAHHEYIDTQANRGEHVQEALFTQRSAPESKHYGHHTNLQMAIQHCISNNSDNTTAMMNPYSNWTWLDPPVCPPMVPTKTHSWFDWCRQHYLPKLHQLI